MGCGAIETMPRLGRRLRRPTARNKGFETGRERGVRLGRQSGWSEDRVGHAREVPVGTHSFVGLRVQLGSREGTSPWVGSDPWVWGARATRIW